MTSIFDGQYTTVFQKTADEINAERYTDIALPCLCDVHLLPDGIIPALALSFNLPVTMRLVPPAIRQNIFRALPDLERLRGTEAVVSKAAEVLGISMDYTIVLDSDGASVITILTSVPAYELNEAAWNNFIRPFMEHLLPWTVKLGTFINGHVFEQQLYVGGVIRHIDRVISTGVALNS